MRKLRICIFLLCFPAMLAAKDYYVATDGKDSDSGTKEAPFATLAKAQQVVTAGDVVYIRGGVYKLSQTDITGKKDNLYHCVFLMDKSGESEEKRICYYGYPGERPIFDLSGVKPADGRISVFYVSGSYLHFRNFEIVGTQVIPATGNTQSECLSNRGGNYNIYENLSMHDGMGIGFYLVKGAHNLILNCDAYNNYDSVSGNGSGGNVDGFGGHPDVGSQGNIFYGCRAWWNSDDGFDLIHSGESVSIKHCWAFYNGYKPGGFSSAADGNGIKAGGYGMSVDSKIPDKIPMHIVTNCIAYRNKAGGFYANHHLGGLCFCNNTSFYNRWNYNMVNRKTKEEPVDVGGYGHILKNNLSFLPRESHISNIDQSTCEVKNNSFLPTLTEWAETDFQGVDPSVLVAARKEDGSLPDINFLVPDESSRAHEAKMGYSFEVPDADAGEEDGEGASVVTESNWLMEAAICVNDDRATVEGPGAENFTKFHINGVSVKMKNGAVDLTGYTGIVELKATTALGGIIKLKIKR